MHDPILERALSQVRTERTRDHRRRGGVVAVVGTTLAAAVLAGGVHLGRQSVPATRVLVASSADGIHMTTTVTPADGWVRLRAVVDGIPPGSRCQLVVTDTRGRRYVAGGWVAPGREDTTLTGAAVVPPTDLATISVVTTDNRTLITATAP
ncbi:hypothetical protein [Saccharothrix syringae]|uniref:Anti-sigma factor n=1 Tax=Saccharothrix syringae TaxID=103733 RepID=A0A5Q0H8F2_SACSY|nr:hypothetical protein [Saccharothrix syringae]QFZ22263.1 hypothetical protein EKG83_36925 [Saccharothrix syringae]